MVTPTFTRRLRASFPGVGRVTLTLWALFLVPACALRKPVPSSDGSGVASSLSTFGGSPSVSSAPSASAAPAVAAPPPGVGCALDAPQTLAVHASDLGMRNLTDVADLAVAVRGTEAIAVFAADGDQGCTMDGCYDYHRVFAARLDQQPVRIRTLPVVKLGVSPSAVAAPVVLPDGLRVVTQGHAGAAATPMTNETPPDTLFLVAGETVEKRWEKWFSAGSLASVAAGDHALVVGVGAEWGYWRKGNGGPPSVRMLVIRGANLGNELLLKSPQAAPGWDYSAPAVATSGNLAAVAFLQKPRAGDTTSVVLRMGWVDAESGKLEGTVVQIATGDLGAPSIAIDGGRAHLIWAERVAGSPYLLRHATWDHGGSKPSLPMPLVTPSDSAFAPASLHAGGHYLVAWTAGDQSAHGQVHFGASRASFEQAALSAKPVSAATVNGRDPEMAVDGHQGVVAWTEVDREGRRIVFSKLRCAP